MSDEESILARWARRKRNAATRGQTKPKSTADGPPSETPVASLPSEEIQSLFDPASLPPIESIGSGSDIRPFLAAGVPADLTRAALRRAWSADPAIRDFIGLSENSWDFNAPAGVFGFGSLTVDEARRLLAQVTEKTKAQEPAGAADEHPLDAQTSATAEVSGRGAADPVVDQTTLVGDTNANPRDPTVRLETSKISMQQRKGKRRLLLTAPNRRHGRALPD
jgi:hypothetical protein